MRLTGVNVNICVHQTIIAVLYEKGLALLA